MVLRDTFSEFYRPMIENLKSFYRTFVWVAIRSEEFFANNEPYLGGQLSNKKYGFLPWRKYTSDAIGITILLSVTNPLYGLETFLRFETQTRWAELILLVCQFQFIGVVLFSLYLFANFFALQVLCSRQFNRDYRAKPVIKSGVVTSVSFMLLGTLVSWTGSMIVYLIDKFVWPILTSGNLFYYIDQFLRGVPLSISLSVPFYFLPRLVSWVYGVPLHSAVLVAGFSLPIFLYYYIFVRPMAYMIYLIGYSMKLLLYLCIPFFWPYWINDVRRRYQEHGLKNVLARSFSGPRPQMGGRLANILGVAFIVGFVLYLISVRVFSH
jgi:hypothetical protein